MTFPGLPPLYVAFAMKKEERDEMYNRESTRGGAESINLIFRLIAQDSEIVRININF